MDFDSTFLLLARRYGQHNATTYCRLRYRGMPASKALWWMHEQMALLRRAGKSFDFDILSRCRHAWINP